MPMFDKIIKNCLVHFWALSFGYGEFAKHFALKSMADSSDGRAGDCGSKGPQFKRS